MTDEKWGCWSDGDEVISVIEGSKEAAIEQFAEDFCLAELESEDETRNFSAVVGIGEPVLIANFLPDFDDLLDRIENAVSSEHAIDDDIIDMTLEEKNLAALKYDELISSFAKEHLKQRDWNIFPNGEDVIIHIIDGKYVGWSKEVKGE